MVFKNKSNKFNDNATKKMVYNSNSRYNPKRWIIGNNNKEKKK